MSHRYEHEMDPAGDRRMDLDETDIHLWAVFCDELRDESLLRRYREILSDSELEQESRFRFAKDRRRYLITRALVRTVLSRYCGIPPEEWSFKSNPFGRPEVTNRGIKPEGVCFNVSHTDTLVLLGVTWGRDLGVDIENVSREVSPLEIGERFFSAREYNELQQHEGDAQKQRFFEYWTLKEAYVKARGMGLSIPLDKFSFLLRSRHEIAVTFDESLCESVSAWRFWMLRPAAQFMAAVCAGRGSRLVEDVSLRATIPLVGDKVLSNSVVRASE